MTPRNTLGMEIGAAWLLLDRWLADLRRHRRMTWPLHKGPAKNRSLGSPILSTIPKLVGCLRFLSGSPWFIREGAGFGLHARAWHVMTSLNVSRRIDVEVLLEAREDASDIFRLAEVGNGVGNGVVVFELK